MGVSRKDMKYLREYYRKNPTMSREELIKMIEPLYVVDEKKLYEQALGREACKLLRYYKAKHLKI